MDATQRTDLETEIRAACTRTDFDAAVTLALKGYGPELFGFLVAMQREEAMASEAFSELAERLWLGLAAFSWESSFRTWAYVVARNVVRTRWRTAKRRERRSPETSDSVLEQVAAVVRTETITFLRTEKRTQLVALRDALPEEDRILLILRVDRKLAWDDLARVLSETNDGAPLDRAALTRESARLRKRFQLVKERLRELAKERGILT